MENNKNNLLINRITEKSNKFLEAMDELKGSKYPMYIWSGI